MTFTTREEALAALERGRVGANADGVMWREAGGKVFEGRFGDRSVREVTRRLELLMFHAQELGLRLPPNVVVEPVLCARFRDGEVSHIDRQERTFKVSVPSFPGEQSAPIAFAEYALSDAET